jgi:alpha-L-fucosidase
MGFNVDSKIGELPLEMCETTNDSWGYKTSDKNFKPLKTLIGYLAGAAGRNANLLLNIGPMPNGEFPPESVEQLRQLGEWTSRFGDSIYGTRSGPVAAQSWGVTTQKGNRVFVHVLDSEAKHGEELTLPGLDSRRVKNARLMTGESAVSYDAARNALVVPKSARTDPDTVIVIELSAGR